MNETKHSGFKKRATALAVASCLSFAPWGAEAAGLGKLTVLSGLGQPLRAELDVGANKDELTGMTARLASQDTFKQAGVDFSTALLDLRFGIETRPNGTTVVKVTSAKPINEPFLDFLVELNWPAGRLVREYTFLLDPPEIAANQTSRPVAEARVVETVRGGVAPESKPVREKAVSRPAQQPKLAAESKPESAGTHVVKPGETLRKIADENKFDGVSLEQMLVGLFQANPDAFVGQNINRLKSGAILNLPDKAAVEAVSPTEAKKVYVAQAGDWNAYRHKLAAATTRTPAKDEAAAAQSSGGKITAKVEEKATPAEQGKDQVKVSRAEAGGKGGAAAKMAEAAADQVAKDKALKEAQDRLAMLEKNVNELQKLLEMKNQRLAELEQPPAKKEEPKPAAAVKPAEASKPVEAVKPAEPKVAEAPKPAEVPEAAKPLEAAKPAEEPKPPVVKPVEPPKPKKPPVVVPPPPPEPSVVDSLLEDPLPLIGGGGILALLAGYFLYKRRRGQNSSVETTALPVPSSLGPNSVFRMTGGQSIDTGNTPPQTGDFSQTGPGTIDTDEVDPVAEADVYMAYGRDTQAEEILLEALQKDPQRTAIHAKLLEIYANRHSVKQFETLAGELYAQTAGVGPDWDKVAMLGRGLDPNNPLYSGSRNVATPDATTPNVPDEAPLMPEPLVELPEADVPPAPLAFSKEFEQDALTLPEESESKAAEANVDVGAETLALDADSMTLDFDLGSDMVAPETAQETASNAEVESAGDLTIVANNSDALDFDLGADAAPKAAEPVVVETQPDDELDFDLDASEQTLVAESLEAMPDFSPAGALVMPSATAVEEKDVGQGTWVGSEGASSTALETPASADEMPNVDFDLDVGSPMTQTMVNPDAGSATIMAPSIMNFGGDDENPKLAETLVNASVLDTDGLEFDVKLTDSMFLGQPMTTPDFDIGSINLDLSAAQEPEAPSEPAPVPAAPSPTEELRLAEAFPAEAPVRNEQWEEVNTKLDLAKAYEEMGDLEGARELLLEVASEGPVDLVEQARTILGRIGG